MTLRAREWRERRGLSYRELADRAGIALSTLYRIESGNASPTVLMLEKLAKALEIEVVDFFPPKRKPWRGTRRRV
jgi:transcriptional regulator with XRE-family HTH domain